MQPRNTLSPALREIAVNIRYLICDVDGVLTDGTLCLDAHGEECYKTFNVYDGLGIKLLASQHITPIVISAKQSAPLQARLIQLGIKHRHLGIADKGACLDTLIDTHQITSQQIAYVGDDLNDLAPMRRAALRITVPNAPEYMRQQAHWVTAAAGGAGAVREIAEQLLLAQNTWHLAIEPYL